MRALLDNDVILDFLLIRMPFYTEADEIFVRLQNHEFEAYISAITPINAFYTIRRQKDKATAFKAVEDLLQLIEVCRTDKKVLQNAFTLSFTDYEDAVQCASALAENLDAIVTRNTTDYKNSPVKIYSPGEFLQVL